MTDLVQVLIGGAQVGGWQSMKLTRKRNDLTGSLTLHCFYGSIPASPVLRSVVAGADIQVLIAGQVVFTGSIDKRKGHSSHKGDKGKDHHAHHKGHKEKGAASTGGVTRSVQIGKDSYSVTVTARGKTKALTTSSHQHPTGQINKTTTAQIIQSLTGPFGVSFNDMSGDSTQVERAVFRDGAIVSDEIHRWAVEHNLIANESRDGKLQLNAPGKEKRGVDLILGQNILSCSFEQSEDQSHSKILIKGQRTDPAVWGNAAVMHATTVTLQGVNTFSPYTVQLSGDATPQRMQARAKVEARRQQESAKKGTVEVFNVQSPDGTPWDINQVHFLQIPPENIFDDFVVDGVEYEVSGDELKTTLSLVASSNASSGGTGASQGRSDAQALGAARQAVLGVSTVAGLYPDLWGCAELVFSE